MPRSPKIAIIIPTVDGREDMLALAVESHARPNAPIDCVLILKNRGKCGDAWNEGVALALYQRCSHILFTADDLRANGKWWIPALKATKNNEIPIPILYQWDDTRQNRESWNYQDGKPGDEYLFSRIPFLTAEMARQIFPIPSLHYYSDCFIGEKAATLGIKSRVTAGYEFTHYWASANRIHDSESDRQIFEYERSRL